MSGENLWYGSRVWLSFFVVPNTAAAMMPDIPGRWVDVTSREHEVLSHEWSWQQGWKDLRIHGLL